MEFKEIKALVISAVVVALAFTIAFANGISGLLVNIGALPMLFLVSLITVSIAFIFHELGHRYFAFHFGHYAEYRMWPSGLLLALMFSLFGFVFAAPGAVYIHPKRGLWGEHQPMTARVNGIISASGPAINIALASIFIAILLIFPSLVAVVSYGIIINAWLAIFNLIPFGPLDGKKVFDWSKAVWLAEIAASAAIFAFAVI